MNVISRGIRNAFRNSIRTLSIIIILGLSIGLALAMLVAHKAIDQKIQSVKSSVGNTITVSPAGFNSFSTTNNALTTSQLAKVQNLPHVVSLTENLTDRLTTNGTVSGPQDFADNTSNQSNTTNLTSPVTLNNNGGGSFSGGGFRLREGEGGGFSLPSNFSLPITILGTNDPTHINGTGLQLQSGSFINGSSDSNNAMISTDMATKNNLNVGSTFQAFNTTLKVGAIFASSSNNRGANNTVIVALPTLQRLSNQSGVVTNAILTVDSLDNLASTTNSVKSLLGSTADIQNAQDEANSAVQPLENIKSVSLYSLVGAVIAGAVIILLTMVMIVRERRREIGVLKAIGSSNVRVMSQFAAEAVTFTVMALVVGLGLGTITANPITKALVSSSSNNATPTPNPGGAPGGGFRRFAVAGNNPVVRFGGRFNVTNIHAVVGWNVLLYGLVATLAIAIIGSAAASMLIAKIRPAEVMRIE